MALNALLPNKIFKNEKKACFHFSRKFLLIRWNESDSFATSAGFIENVLTYIPLGMLISRLTFHIDRIKFSNFCFGSQI